MFSKFKTLMYSALVAASASFMTVEKADAQTFYYSPGGSYGWSQPYYGNYYTPYSGSYYSTPYYGSYYSTPYYGSYYRGGWGNDWNDNRYYGNRRWNNWDRGGYGVQLGPFRYYNWD